ncbi:amidohydrolase family protein [Nocardioides sp. B-3]|uniref:amidohydrolase family protein n=1 Tax=Nocardioides sp. B-3 TaxID=2895565 RepID=UPI003FA5C6D7
MPGPTSTSRPAKSSGSPTSTSTRARRSFRSTATPSTSLTSTRWRPTSRGLNFVVEHCGLPRPEDFCWIATRETNVHAGLAVAMPFIHTRPRYFAQIIGELLYWVGEDKIQFSSDYAIWTPKWLIEAFVDFQIPEDMTEYPELTATAKKKILGLNAAKMYGLNVPADLQLADADDGSADLDVAAGAKQVVSS